LLTPKRVSLRDDPPALALRGIAMAVTEFAFTRLGARRGWCGADEENVRSWRVAERLSFEHEGTLKGERCDPDGTRRTMRIYAMTR
jgi:RimJ/RimL family protein N-acetyltransferase